MRAGVVTALLLVAPAALAEEKLHFTVAGGVGLAFDGIGLRVEAGYPHWAAFVGYGLHDCFLKPVLNESVEKRSDKVLGHGAAGIRWFHGKAQGLVLSLQYAWTRCSYSSEHVPEPHPNEQWDYYAVTVVWRWQFGAGDDRGFVEIAAGPVLRYAFFYEADELGFKDPVEYWSFGLFGRNDGAPVGVPDLSFALGAEF